MRKARNTWSRPDTRRFAVCNACNYTKMVDDGIPTSDIHCPMCGNHGDFDVYDGVFNEQDSRTPPETA